MIRYLTLGVFALSLSACAQSGPKQIGGPSGVTAVAATEMPAPTQTDFSVSTGSYAIGPMDKLVIDVFGVEELAKLEVQVDAGGRVSFPLAGSIQTAGKSPSELESVIAQRLREKYIRNPQVTVNILESNSQSVTVDGQVTQPGIYPIIGKMSLMRAVASAKGTSEDAKLEEVVVFRTVNGQRMAALYNLKAIRDGLYNDPEIYTNDIVIVGDSPERRRIREALQIVPALATPIIVLLQGII